MPAMKVDSDPMKNIVIYKSKLEEFREKRNSEIARAYEQGNSVASIAEKLAMSRRAIYWILRDQGHYFLGGTNVSR